MVDGAEDGIQDMLVACELERTRIQIQWLDGSNEYEARVRVTVSTPYQPVVGVLVVPVLRARSCRRAARAAGLAHGRAQGLARVAKVEL